jgi:exonuclease SbcC
MRILSVEFKNFASYGNKLQKIDFSENDGMFYLVTGENGSGKSTISDVIKFGIYGKLGNKRLRDIPNRFNQQTYVKVILEAKGSRIVIERGISPNFLKLWVNGNEYDQAGKKNAEDYIVDEIIGLPFYVFNNIVSLSINDFKSFLNMSPHDKRMIIDKIFSLEIINNVKWLVKSEIKRLRDLSISYSKQVETIEQSIENSQKELDILKNKIETDAKKKRTNILASIEEYNSKMNKVKQKLTSVDKKMNQATTKLDNLRELLEKNNSAKLRIDEKKSLYEKQKCPMCESDLTTDFHKSMLDEVIEKEGRIKENIEKLTSTIESIKETQTKIRKAKSLYNSKKIEFSTIITNYKEQLSKLDSSDKNSQETAVITKIINEATDRRKKYIRQQDQSENKMNFYKLIEDIFGDNGVKQLAITKIMPALNSEIRQVLAELRMDYKVTFNKNFDAIITHLGHEVAIQQLSTGEKKKIDFAALIAIIRLMKIKYPTMNITFLDEIFASIDSDGIHHILKILQDTSKNMNINIFVVNHAPLPAEIFDYRISISKPNNFSNIEVEKID